MAKIEDADPMLQPLPSQSARTHLGPVVRGAGLVLFLLAVKAVLQNTTKCDQALSSCIQWVLNLATVAILREAAVVAGAKGRIVKAATIAVASGAMGLWLYGHLLVYMSGKCDMEVWYLAFLLLVWLDVAAFFLCIALFLLPLFVHPRELRILH